MIVLALDDAAPSWSPSVSDSTPESLRAAARWLVERGHAPDLNVEMVYVLLALFVAGLEYGAHGPVT